MFSMCFGKTATFLVYYTITVKSMKVGFPFVGPLSATAHYRKGAIQKKFQHLHFSTPSGLSQRVLWSENTMSFLSQSC